MRRGLPHGGLSISHGVGRRLLRRAADHGGFQMREPALLRTVGLLDHVCLLELLKKLPICRLDGTEVRPAPSLRPRRAVELPRTRRLAAASGSKEVAWRLLRPRLRRLVRELLAPRWGGEDGAPRTAWRGQFAHISQHLVWCRCRRRRRSARHTQGQWCASGRLRGRVVRWTTRRRRRGGASTAASPRRGREERRAIVACACSLEAAPKLRDRALPGKLAGPNVQCNHPWC